MRAGVASARSSRYVQSWSRAWLRCFHLWASRRQATSRETWNRIDSEKSRRLRPAAPSAVPRPNQNRLRASAVDFGSDKFFGDAFSRTLTTDGSAGSSAFPRAEFLLPSACVH